MAHVEHISVVVEDDFLARQSRAQPIAALAELIWNALDADATRVDIELVHGDLAGGLSRIIVADNGTGFSRSEAAALFGKLGGSWKRMTRRTRRDQRMVHGQEGRGRYKAFALGESVKWKVRYAEGGQTLAFEIDLFANDLSHVSISDSEPAPGQGTGVTVEVADVLRDFRVFGQPEGLQELTEIFALYLKSYKSVSIRTGGTQLDPDAAIASEQVIPLAPIRMEEGAEHRVELQIIEWHSEAKRTLYLCSEDGFPLEQVETRFHVPGFTFSAYLKSSYISLLHNEERLALAEMDPLLKGSVEAAREAIKDYFRQRAAELARSMVDEWKEAEVYPYAGEPTSPIERAERQVFDIVAVNVQEFAPELLDAPSKTRALHMRMLRAAIERGPEELQLILKEVLDLPAKKQKELASLLQETTLSAIITAAKTVADRLKFIAALENIVFEPELKGRLKERSQLHKILAENTWVFGEEYNLWVSDRDLKRVLEKHKKHLDPDIAVDEPVKVVGKTRGIVDLMFSRAARRHRADDIEQLVVELKAPRVKIGADEITQANRYSLAVRNDEARLPPSAL